MENSNESTRQPGNVPGQSQYVPAGIPRQEFSRTDPRYKSPTLATLMSIVPGLGQIYIGYYQQGFINIIVIASIITLLNLRGIRNLEPFLGFFLAFYWLFNMVDAYRKATFYNQTLAGLGPLEFPEGEQLPGMRGSLAAGVLLMAVGGVALAHTRFGLPIEWIERWWPMALILMGAWLLYGALAKKQRRR